VLTLSGRLEAMSRLGRALADPTRCRILLALLDGPQYPAALAEDLHLTRSNTSNHLACLRGCGLVVAVAEGRRTRYELVDPHLRHALSDLLHVVPLVAGERPCDGDADRVDVP
jgi:ArsR family transcriptional regulator, cadmium/lead-responsive transcriptional repressor